MQRSDNLIRENGKMKTKPGQNTNEFNCVDSMVPLIWTPVDSNIKITAWHAFLTLTFHEYLAHKHICLIRLNKVSESTCGLDIHVLKVMHN
jgi:hypothetical protein